MSEIEKLLIKNLEINDALATINCLAFNMGKSLPGYNNGAEITESDYKKEFKHLNKVVDKYNTTTDKEITIVASGIAEKGSKFRLYDIAFVADEY